MRTSRSCFQLYLVYFGCLHKPPSLSVLETCLWMFNMYTNTHTRAQSHMHACTNRKRLKSKRENMFPLACGFRVPGPSSGESIAFRSVVPHGSGREPTGEQNDSPHKQAAKKHEAGASLFTIPTACKAFYKARLLKSCTGSQAPPLRPRL